MREGFIRRIWGYTMELQNKSAAQPHRNWYENLEKQQYSSQPPWYPIVFCLLPCVICDMPYYGTVRLCP